MKTLFVAVLLLGSFFSGPLFACVNGDTSKILLVVTDTLDGEEQAVVGEIIASDGSIQMTRDSFRLDRVEGNWIYVRNIWTRYTFKFNRLNARDAQFCFKAIFSDPDVQR